MHIKCCLSKTAALFIMRKKIGLLQEKNPQGSSRKVSLTFTLQETYTEFEISTKIKMHVT